MAHRALQPQMASRAKDDLVPRRFQIGQIQRSSAGRLEMDAFLLLPLVTRPVAWVRHLLQGFKLAVDDGRQWTRTCVVVQVERTWDCGRPKVETLCSHRLDRYHRYPSRHHRD